MLVKSFFHPIHLTGPNLKPRKFLGTAFPVTPNGGLITCRHVIDVDKEDSEKLAVFDEELRRMVPIDVTSICYAPTWDLSFIPNALGRQKREFFPILPPDRILLGMDVYSVGFYKSGENIDVGCFKGHIVNFPRTDGTPDLTDISLSYPVIEGLSGSPVLTYHNGPKVVGLCHGNFQSRILASEVLEYQDKQLQLKETINRIVEHGQAYNTGVLIEFLEEVGVQGQVVSSERVPGIFENDQLIRDRTEV